MNNNVTELIEHPKSAIEQQMDQKYANPILINYSSKHLSYEGMEVKLEKALNLLDEMSSREEFSDSYATFHLLDQNGCIQFLNFNHKTWLFDIPVDDGPNWNNETLNKEVQKEIVFKIVKEFFSRCTFFHYVISQNYHAIIQLVKELWDINIDAKFV